MPLSSHWKFHLGDVPGAQAPGFDDRSWRTLNLPHTWNALDAQNGSPRPVHDGLLPGRRVVSQERRRSVRLRGQRLFLEFGGAASVADVYVNGVLVGHNEDPFMRFRVDVTEALGDGGTIAVKVDNSARPYIAPLIGDFPIFGGLYRGVWLIAANATHLDLLDAGGGSGVIVRQQQLTATSASVRVTSSVVSPEGARLLTRIADRSGKVVAQATAAAGANVSQTLEVPNPHRWNGTADPYLYSVRVAVVVDGQVVDAVRQPLGLRTITIDPAQGLLLNGRRYQVHGVNRHQDWENYGWAISAAPIRRLALMREMGVNALRTAHYPQDELVYDLADRYGLLVYTEVPYVGVASLLLGSNASPELTANLVSQARAMVRGLGNHPSIAWWGIGNEQGDRPDVHANLEAIENTIKAEDPTRLTAFAAEASANDANLASRCSATPTCPHTTSTAGGITAHRAASASGWTPSTRRSRSDASASPSTAPARASTSTPSGPGPPPAAHSARSRTPRSTRPTTTHSYGRRSRRGRGCGARLCGTCSTSRPTAATRATAPASTTRGW